jgi:hypothetical protein
MRRRSVLKTTISDVFGQSLRAREAEWELGTLATDNIVRHSQRAEITTLHEVLWMRPRVPPTPPR